MKRIIALFALAASLATPARAAFTPPTREQLQAVAQEPPRVVVLLKDANAEQAAEVGKDTIVEIIKLDLKPRVRDARIAQLVRHLFLAMPEDDWTELAIAFGKAIAGSPTASMSPAIVSAIQRAIIEYFGAKHGTAFGNAYNLAMMSIAGAPGGGKYVPPQPPPPPVALPYEAQRLR
jgi:hypothetical protein